MEAYLVLKFIHVLAAVVWVGGGLLATFLTIHARRDGRRLLQTMGVLSPMAMVMAPASLLVLLSGGALVWLGAWGFEAWIVLALIVAGASFLVGMLLLGPTFGKVGAALARDDQAEALRLVRGLDWPGRLEQAALILVVCLMVLKPGWGDLALTGGLAVILVSAVAWINTRSGRALAA